VTYQHMLCEGGGVGSEERGWGSNKYVFFMGPHHEVHVFLGIHVFPVAREKINIGLFCKRDL